MGKHQLNRTIEVKTRTTSLDKKSRAASVINTVITSGNPANFSTSVFPPLPLSTSPADSGVSVVDEVPSACRPQVTLGLAYSLGDF